MSDKLDVLLKTDDKSTVSLEKSPFFSCYYVMSYCSGDLLLYTTKMLMD